MGIMAEVYSEEYLKEEDKVFMKGFDYVVEQEVKPSVANYLYDYEGKMDKGVVADIVTDFLQYLENVLEESRVEKIALMIRDYSKEELDEIFAKCKGE